MINEKELKEKYTNASKETIKKNLRICMIKHGFTTADMSRKLGKARNSVYAWTNISNRNIPVFEDAVKLAKLFNFDFNEIIEGRNSNV